MKVLRVGMTYPRDKEPGVGLHNHYHSFFSQNDEFIITSKRDGNLWENREGVRVVEIEFNNPKMAVYKDGVVKKIRLLFGKVFSQIKFYKKAKKYIYDFKPDIIHIYTPIPILCGLYAKKKFKSKIVMSLHGSDALRISKNKFMGVFLKIPDAIVSVSESIEDVLSRYKEAKNIICIGNGVDLSVFKNKHIERKKQFIHVANLRWQKDQESLLKAFSLFYSQNNEYKLIIIGEGEERPKLKALCKELNIADAVEFKGTQSREYIADELNKSKAFILTSVTEGFPKVIIEAMATATPVISTDVGNIKNVVSDNGIITQTQNPQQIFEAMKKISEDNEMWEKFSKLSEEKSKQYSWQTHTNKLQKVYEDVLYGK